MATVTSFEVNMLPPGEYTRSVCPVHMQQRPPFPDSYSIFVL